MPDYKVVRVADERIPGRDWLVVRDLAGEVWAFVRASVEMGAELCAAIRRAVAAVLATPVLPQAV